MKRYTEWGLSILAVLLCLSGIVLILRANTFSQPGNSLWPMPALILLQILLLGIFGLGVALAGRGQIPTWAGLLTWVAGGGMAAMSLFGLYGISSLSWLAIPAIACITAAVLADRRQKHNLLEGVRASVISAIVNFGLLFVFILGLTGI